MSFHAANVSLYWQYDTIVTKRCSSCPLYTALSFGWLQLTMKQMLSNKYIFRIILKVMVLG